MFLGWEAGCERRDEMPVVMQAAVGVLLLPNKCFPPTSAQYITDSGKQRKHEGRQGRAKRVLYLFGECCACVASQMAQICSFGHAP